MPTPKVWVKVTWENGVLDVRSNVSAVETVGTLDAGKWHVLRSIMGPPVTPAPAAPSPDGEPAAVATASAAGFAPRRVAPA